MSLIVELVNSHECIHLYVQHFITRRAIRTSTARASVSATHSVSVTHNNKLLICKKKKKRKKTKALSLRIMVSRVLHDFSTVGLYLTTLSVLSVKAAKSDIQV